MVVEIRAERCFFRKRSVSFFSVLLCGLNVELALATLLPRSSWLYVGFFARPLPLPFGFSTCLSESKLNVATNY